MNDKIYYIIKSIVLIAFLAFFTYEDIKSRKVSNIVVIIMAAAGLLLVCVTASWDSISKSLICSAVTGAAAFLTEILSRGGLGRGDVLILTAVGLYIGGWSMFLIVFISLLALCIFSLVGLALRKVNLKSKLPFIPFLLVGVIIGSLI